jgi:hypothetical protein
MCDFMVRRGHFSDLCHRNTAVEYHESGLTEAAGMIYSRMPCCRLCARGRSDTRNDLVPSAGSFDGHSVIERPSPSKLSTVFRDLGDTRMSGQSKTACNGDHMPQLTRTVLYISRGIDLSGEIGMVKEEHS